MGGNGKVVIKYGILYDGVFDKKTQAARLVGEGSLKPIDGYVYDQEVERNSIDEIIAHGDKFYYYDDKPVFDTIGQVPNWGETDMKNADIGALKYHKKFMLEAAKDSQSPQPSAPPASLIKMPCGDCELGELAA